MKKRIIHTTLWQYILLLLTLFFFFSPCAPVFAQQSEEADLLTVRERLADVLVGNRHNSITKLSPAVQALMSTLSSDGSWPEINYNDRSRAIWAPQRHLDNLMMLTESYVRLTDTKENQELRTTLKNYIDRALFFWFTRDPQSDNGWYNTIGSQLTLIKIGLLLDDELTPEQRSNIVKILARSNTDKMAGANLTWTAEINVVRGILTRSPDITATALDKIVDGIKIVPGSQEGIKADGSFYQHGPQLYNGGYGAAFLSEASWFLSVATGTAFQFPTEKAEILDSFVLDGTRWMVWKNIRDYSTRGREITRLVQSTSETFLTNVCKNLKNQNTVFQSEIGAFCDELTNKHNPLTGNKHFWLADYMVHRRADWMISVKMLSERTISGELVNDEGRRSHLLSDGLTYIYNNDGLAYHNIFPVWDWKRLPGITAEWSSELPQGQVGTHGTSAFAGGVSDGTYGACAFILGRETLQAHKAWFFFDDECVALGSGIDCNSNLPVFTSMNQCLLQGDVVFCDENGEQTAGSNAIAGKSVKWVYHDGVGYLFPQKQKTVLQSKIQIGSWQEINGSLSATPISAPVFSLWIDHGVRPQNASYQYLIVPQKLPEIRNYAASIPISVLTNTPKVQAVEHLNNGILEAVFYDPGTVVTSSGLQVTVDHPAIILLRRKGTQVEISAANPVNKPLVLNLTLSIKLTGGNSTWENGVTRIKMNLPDGDHAGQSVTEIFTAKQ